jgi:hypothetical protein
MLFQCLSASVPLAGVAEDIFRLVEVMKKEAVDVPQRLGMIHNLNRQNVQ